MSNPPSPPRQPPTSTQPEIVSSAPGEPLTSAPVVPFTSAFSFPPSIPPSYGPPAGAPLGPSPYASNYPYPTTYPTQPGLYQGAAPVVTGGYGASAVPAPLGVSSAAGPAGSTLARPARKSKAHVASACINCKRAHLSCDVQRPCARCVASGKQHKKRGRPRLREEGEFNVEQMVREPAAGSSAQAQAEASASRPITGTKHRRTESLRSLRSQASEGSSPSSIPTPMFAPAGMMLPPPPAMPPPSRELAPSEIPTAYLDLDLRVIRANEPFQSILAGGRNLNGQHLSVFTAPADEESFQAIRNNLRAERELIDPTFMPPILEPGQDPLQNVSEADLDRLSQPFADRTYTWARNQPGAPAEAFPARVRLAKAHVYFVAVTLPTFRPRPPAAQGYVSPTAMRAEAPRQPIAQQPLQAPQYPPPSYGYLPPPSERSTFGQGPSPSPRAPPQLASPFTPYQTLQPSQQLPPPFPAGQQPTMELPALASPYIGRPTSQEPSQQREPPVQLAPFLGASAAQTSAQAGSSSSSRPEESATQQRAASDDGDDDQETPRKKRRVGIEDIIQ
ncbi:uncharacterized protein LTR77_009118 [Saxophila tyrrhenica]|uniref:Zn(2)-C6 fungal-type domain-containing protein n=1 Tax=Saxophila tyrrhenica TaxID=1690608 RepID=A0AAV9P2H7_9PEZI|nr:hypothetical protein LTR77_009118 [Saxophila tyrrhenica]